MSEHSAEVQAIIDQYSSKQEQPEFQLSANGVNRMQEYMRNTGKDREDPAVLTKALLQARAEQKPVDSWGGVGKRGTAGTYAGRSLAEIARNK